MLLLAAAAGGGEGSGGRGASQSSAPVAAVAAPGWAAPAGGAAAIAARLRRNQGAHAALRSMPTARRRKLDALHATSAADAHPRRGGLGVLRREVAANTASAPPLSFAAEANAARSAIAGAGSRVVGLQLQVEVVEVEASGLPGLASAALETAAAAGRPSLLLPRLYATVTANGVVRRTSVRAPALQVPLVASFAGAMRLAPSTPALVAAALLAAEREQRALNARQITPEVPMLMSPPQPVHGAAHGLASSPPPQPAAAAVAAPSGLRRRQPPPPPPPARPKRPTAARLQPAQTTPWRWRRRMRSA